MRSVREIQTLRAVLLVIALGLGGSPAQAKYGGGSGTAADPYQIWTPEQMNAIGADPNDWDKHFKLMADIDLSAYDGQDDRPAFNIIAADSGDEFTGVFDGDGYTIANFTHVFTDRYRYSGLFGYVGGARGEIRNLGVIDVMVDVGSGWSAGALAGTNGGAIIHCYSSGTIRSSGSCVGGLVGNNWGLMAGCHSAGAVAGEGSYTGGLVGLHDEGVITGCYSTASVSGTRADVGGLVGPNLGAVIECYSTGVVSGPGNSGGLVGWTDRSMQGLAGTVTSSFWDVATSGRSQSAGGTGLTTERMQDVQTYLKAGWDWLGTVENGTSEIWQMPAGGGCPVLAFFQGYTPPRLRGEGTPDDPYLIANAEDLGAMRYHSPFAHYRLAAPIDLSGIRWSTPVIPWFAGVFDGDGLTISHLTIAGDESLGLFGQLAYGAQVRDLAVVDANVAGSGYYVGALAACNHGTIVHCYTTGTTRGDQKVGGLAGANFAWGAVTQCYSTASVQGRWSVGALLGENAGTVTHCYGVRPASGSAKPPVELVGMNWGAVTGCFVDSPNPPQGSGGSRRSPLPEIAAVEVTPMQDKQTYIAAGWDWVGETANGTSEIWQMPEGGGYPVLSVFSGYTPVPLSGRGTPDDPYLVSDVNELGAVVHYGPCANYRLTAPIDVSGIRWSVPVVPAFAGVFDGDGLTISHLTIHGGGHLGLFGQLASGAEVRNLGIEDANVVGSGEHVGGLVGFGHDGRIIRCHSDGTIKGNRSVGGLVGRNRLGDVMDCRSAGAVNGKEEVGGLLGYNTGHVTRGDSAGHTTGEESVGGVVGTNGGSLDDCHSTGTVEGVGGVGGLTGLNWGGTVAHCSNSGAVNGRSRVGGLAGGSTDQWGWSSYRGMVTDCCNLGPVVGSYEVGGLMGDSRDAIANCHSTGAVSGNAYVGGLVGTSLGSVMRSSSDGVVDGNECVGGLVGLNDGTMDWSRSEGAVSGRQSVGGLVGRNSGTVVSCCSTGDVTGDVNDVGGLVGRNWFASIMDSCSRNAVAGEANDVGGLVGANWVGSITNCYSTSTITGGNYVGGLVGIDWRVYDYVSDQKVYTRGTVRCCYFAGEVSGQGRVGGIVGAPGGVFTSYFWDRQVSGLTEMFGEPDPGAIGCDNSGAKTTAEMQTARMYLDAGWDFVGETANGAEDIWWILEGQDYPRLWWEDAAVEIRNSNIEIRNKHE